MTELLPMLQNDLRVVVESGMPTTRMRFWSQLHDCVAVYGGLRGCRRPRGTAGRQRLRSDARLHRSRWRRLARSARTLRAFWWFAFGLVPQRHRPFLSAEQSMDGPATSTAVRRSGCGTFDGRPDQSGRVRTAGDPRSVAKTAHQSGSSSFVTLGGCVDSQGQ